MNFEYEEEKGWDEYGAVYDEDEDEPHDIDYGEEDEEDEFAHEQEVVLQDEFRDRERLGAGVIGCWVTGVDNKPLKTQTPLGKFCLKVDAISNNIRDQCQAIFDLTNGDIQKLFLKSEELPRVEYKNATAFVLGYLATQGGTIPITKKSLASTWECYMRTDSINKDESIKKPDIIRYARLWV